MEGLCGNCRFFRIKSDTRGICDNEKVNKKIHPCIGCSEEIYNHPEPTVLRAELNSNLDFRVDEDFGCIHFEESKDELWNARGY